MSLASHLVASKAESEPNSATFLASNGCCSGLQQPVLASLEFICSLRSLKVSVFLRSALVLFERLWLFGLFWFWLALGMGSLGLEVGIFGHACVELNLRRHVSLGSSAGCAKHLQLL